MLRRRSRTRCSLFFGLDFHTSTIEDTDHDALWLALLDEVRQPGAHAPNCSVTDCDWKNVAVYEMTTAAWGGKKYRALPRCYAATFWLKFVHVVVTDLPRLINWLEGLERWLSVPVVVETAVPVASKNAEARHKLKMWMLDAW